MTQPDPPDHQPTTVCPECGGPSREIVYGMPSEEFAEAADDDIVIAGCCIDVDVPDRECKVCEHQWQSPDFRDDLRKLLGLGLGPGSSSEHR